MIAPPLPARRSNNTFNAGFSVTESALTTTIKSLKLLKAKLFMAKKTGEDVAEKYFKINPVDFCTTNLEGLKSITVFGINVGYALFVAAAIFCFIFYGVVWLIFHALIVQAKIAYHTVDITIAGLEIFKTDFAKGECEVGRSDPAVQRTHFVA